MNKIFSLEELGIGSAIGPTVPSNPNTNKFLPVGIGKPLTIRLHTVYVGDLKNGIIDRNQAIIVSSIIKDDATYEVPARGVHQLIDAVKDRETLYPRAGVEGTELIYYTPVFEDRKLLIDIEVKADRFNKKITDSLSNAFSAAAGVPIFALYTPYMIAGSQLLSISGNILNKVLEKKNVLEYNFNVRDNIGGLSNSDSGFIIGLNTKGREEFMGYDIVEDPYNAGNVLLMKDGKSYQGDLPYAIFSVDGRKNDEYKKFKATSISSGLLNKFYGESETSVLDDVHKMTQLYSDFNYLKKANKALADLEGDISEEKRKELEALYRAFRSNITNEELKKTLATLE